MIIQVKLKDIIRNDLADEFGLNPYCLAEGADGESYIVCEIDIPYNVMQTIKRIDKELI